MWDVGNNDEDKNDNDEEDKEDKKMWELLEALGRRRELILSVLKAAIHPTHLRLLYNTIKIQTYKYTRIHINKCLTPPIPEACK